MNIYTFRKPLIFTSLIAIGGCGSSPPLQTYSMPDKSLPSAKVKIIPSYVGRHDSARVEREEFECSNKGTVIARHTTNLAVFRMSSQEPVEVTLPAGDANFYVGFREGDFSCSLPFSTYLEANHTYTLSSSLVGRGLLSVRKCELELIDSATRTLAPIYMRDKGKSIGNSVCQKFGRSAGS